MEIPERIWLQTGSDAEHGEADGPVMHNHDMTWCQDAIYKHDTEYVRADLYNAAVSKLDNAERGWAAASETAVKLESRLEALTKELDEREDYELCDTCGYLSTETADDDGEGNPLGHVQCAQCSRIAELEYQRSTAREHLQRERDRADGLADRLDAIRRLCEEKATGGDWYSDWLSGHAAMAESVLDLIRAPVVEKPAQFASGGAPDDLPESTMTTNV